MGVQGYYAQQGQEMLGEALEVQSEITREVGGKGQRRQRNGEKGKEKR